jgi:hypothetical protein
MKAFCSVVVAVSIFGLVISSSHHDHESGRGSRDGLADSDSSGSSRFEAFSHQHRLSGGTQRHRSPQPKAPKCGIMPKVKHHDLLHQPVAPFGQIPWQVIVVIYPSVWVSSLAFRISKYTYTYIGICYWHFHVLPTGFSD